MSTNTVAQQYFITKDLGFRLIGWLLRETKSEIVVILKYNFDLVFKIYYKLWQIKNENQLKKT